MGSLVYGIMTGARRWLLRVGLLLVSVSLVLTIGEAITRRRAPKRVNPFTNEDIELPELRSLEDLSGPNVRGFHAGVFYRTNSRTLRGREYVRNPPRGEYRVAIAGDSVTVGWGVEEAGAYPAQLEDRLNATIHKRTFEVMNLGLAGINGELAIRRLIQKARYYRFHLAIYGFTLNDIEGPSYRRLPEASLRAERFRESLRYAGSRFHLLRALWPRWILLRDRFSSSSIETEYAEWYQNYFENPAAWEEFLVALDLLADFTRRRSICGHVFIHTYLTELRSDHPLLPIYQKVAQAATERGLSVTQSFPFFEGQDERDLRISALDSHPNLVGHTLLADALQAGLQEMPKPCWVIWERKPVLGPSAE